MLVTIESPYLGVYVVYNASSFVGHPVWISCLYDKTNKKATSLLLFCLYSQSTLARRKRADDACPSGASPLGAGCGSTYLWAEALRYLGAGAGEVGGKYLKVNFFSNVYFLKLLNMYIFQRYVKFRGYLWSWKNVWCFIPFVYNALKTPK